MGLLKELINEMRSIRRSSYSSQKRHESLPNFIRGIKTQADLGKMLIGTTWRKKNDVETIMFQDESTFLSNHAGDSHWKKNSYVLGDRLGQIVLTWSSDGFEAECEFFEGFTKFIEIVSEECVWTLIK